MSKVLFIVVLTMLLVIWLPQVIEQVIRAATLLVP